MDMCNPLDLGEEPRRQRTATSMTPHGYNPDHARLLVHSLS
jgi:hypothetical protein